MPEVDPWKFLQQKEDLLSGQKMKTKYLICTYFTIVFIYRINGVVIHMT